MPDKVWYGDKEVINIPQCFHKGVVILHVLTCFD